MAFVLLVLLLLGGIWIFLPPGQAQLTGLVCLAPAGATACPAPPVTIGGLVGAQLTVNVVIQGSDSINGFDITLKTDHTVLKPADAVADTTSLLTGGSVI